MKMIKDFKALQLKIASPETILSWSYGEVKKPETINYRTLKPEKDGLFDEKIFGPVKDFECHCGKYKRARYKGIICDKCGVEVTYSRVRRERMGHIKLAAPVAHIWFFKGAPSKLSLLLDISPRNLNAIIYFSKYIVLSIDKDKKLEVLDKLEKDAEADIERLKKETIEFIENLKKKFDEQKENLKQKVKTKEILKLKVEELEVKTKQKIKNAKVALDAKIEKTKEIYKTIKQMVKKIDKGTILTEDEYYKLYDYDAVDHIRVGMGSEALLELVNELDLVQLKDKLRKEMKESSGPKKVKVTKRLKVIEGFLRADIDPAWMFLINLPVLPPDLRPMVQLSGGRFASSDLNDLYRRVINRNNRLKHLINLGAPEIILRNEKRMLQEAVDALIDGNQAKATRRRTNRKELKSLTEMLSGKQGRFRQNLLGKRVDYSGRSVIVVGPELKLNECGLPKNVALEMFKPYVLHELIVQGIAPNIKTAKNLVEAMEPEVYDVLEKVTKDHPVLLNRAPTLHKLGIQAFYPRLIEGNAIQLHPCVCSGFNADFDGDQMAVHVPLTKKAQEEAKTLMMPKQNLLKPANGDAITVPNKDIALGCFYSTSIDNNLEKFERVFSSKKEALYAYELGVIKLRQKIDVYLDEKDQKGIVETTIGRIMFNDLLPDVFDYINEPINAAYIKIIVTQAIRKMDDNEEISELIDKIKDFGFKYVTLSGLSISVADCKMVPKKDEIIEEANKKSKEIQYAYQNGLLTNEERKKQLFKLWMNTTDKVADLTWNSYSDDNAVKIVINSGGTRASKDQVKQLAAMRGLVVDPLGNIVEMPTKSNFRQGLTIFEYVTSARGSRKGLTDTALKTADAGYLTRRLCDVAHALIIKEDDCGTDEGIYIKRENRPNSFKTRIYGRFLQKDVKVKGKIIAKKGDLIDEDLAEKIDKSGVDSVFVRSPLTCKARHGLCVKCYGIDLSTRKVVKKGVPVGIVAGQSIGEPGTQLTMRVKHSGGIVGKDVTQGLPRVEELFEARTPKSKAIIAPFSGKVIIEKNDSGITLKVRGTVPPIEEKVFELGEDVKLLVKNNQKVNAGDKLTQGNIDLKEYLAIKGLVETQKQIVNDAQNVYESQGISIHDKHFEVIVRNMGDKVKIDEVGDTKFVIGEIVERVKFLEENEKVLAAGGEPATAKVLLLGITRSALYTSSWLSAASFQHTKHILTDAAATGAIDELQGLKENVIIGRLIPVFEDS